MFMTGIITVTVVDYNRCSGLCIETIDFISCSRELLIFINSNVFFYFPGECQYVTASRHCFSKLESILNIYTETQVQRVDGV